MAVPSLAFPNLASPCPEVPREQTLLWTLTTNLSPPFDRAFHSGERMNVKDIGWIEEGGNKPAAHPAISERRVEWDSPKIHAFRWKKENVSKFVEFWNYLA